MVLLFPHPRRVERFDDSVRVDAPVVIVNNPGLPAQGYCIDVQAERATLKVADSAGRRYGEATIAQLRRSDGSLPAIHIEDWPDFPTRAYMLDVSRDRVPTRASLEQLVSRLATCRYNQLQLYIEHTFANPAHRVVWADASPITPDDLRWLEERCAGVGIELAVNQNTFGHFERWLAKPDYRSRAECPDGFEIVPGITLPPSVLAPTQANATFALDLVHAQLACARSHTVNIGCDETFELGKGVSAGEVAGRGLGQVYVEHLGRIMRPLLDEGFQVQYWADVVRHHPEAMGQLPDDGTTALVWNYDAPDAPRPVLDPAVNSVLASIGIDVAGASDFGSILQPFLDAERDFWVAPGTSTWSSFTGRLDNAEANLTDAAVAGLAAGATGFLLTDWGDNGHHQPPAISLPPIALGGAVAWCAASNSDLDVTAAIDTYLVHDQAHLFGGILDRIGRAARRTGVTTANASPLFGAVVFNPLDMSSGSPDAEQLRAVIDDFESARDDLGRVSLLCDDGADLVAGTDIAIGLACHGAKRLHAKARGGRVDTAAAIDEMTSLIDAYRSAWLSTSRPGGLDDSAARLEARLDRYRAGRD